MLYFSEIVSLEQLSIRMYLSVELRVCEIHDLRSDKLLVRVCAIVYGSNTGMNGQHHRYVTHFFGSLSSLFIWQLEFFVFGLVGVLSLPTTKL